MKTIMTNVGNFTTTSDILTPDDENKLKIETTSNKVEMDGKVFSCKEEIELDLNHVVIFGIKTISDLNEVPLTIEKIEDDIIKLEDEIEEKKERLDSLKEASKDEDFQKYAYHKAESKKYKEIYNKK